jgi:hypothetical protein
MTNLRNSLLLSAAVLWGIQSLSAGNDENNPDEKGHLVIKLRPPQRSQPQAHQESREDSSAHTQNPHIVSEDIFNVYDRQELMPLFGEWRHRTLTSLVDSKEIEIKKNGHSGAVVFKLLTKDKPYWFKIFETGEDSSEFESTQKAWKLFFERKLNTWGVEDTSCLNLSSLIGIVRSREFLGFKNRDVLIFDQAPGVDFNSLFCEFLEDKIDSLGLAIQDVAEQMALFHKLMRPIKKTDSLILAHDQQQSDKFKKVRGCVDREAKASDSHVFEPALDLFNQEYRHKLIDDLLFQIMTVTHGDAHSENIYYDPNSHQVTFIDYGKMSKTLKGFDNPCQDIGRFLGSLWFTAGLRIFGNNFNPDEALRIIFKLKEIDKEFLKSYVSTFPQQERKSIKKLIKVGTEFYKREYYATKLDITNKEESKKVERENFRRFLSSLQYLQYCGEDIFLKSVCGIPDLTGTCLQGNNSTGVVRVSKDGLYKEKYPKRSLYYWRMEPHFIDETLVFSLRSNSPGEDTYLAIDNQGHRFLQSKHAFWEFSSDTRVTDTCKIKCFNPEDPKGKGVELFATDGIPGGGDHWRFIPLKFFKWGHQKDKLDTSPPLEPLPTGNIKHPIHGLCNQDVIITKQFDDNKTALHMFGDTSRGLQFTDNKHVFNKTTDPNRGYHWKIVPYDSDHFFIERIVFQNKRGPRKYLGFHEGKVFLNNTATRSTLWRLIPQNDSYVIESCNADSEKRYLDAKEYGTEGGPLILSDSKTQWRIITWDTFDSLPH